MQPEAPPQPAATETAIAPTAPAASPAPDQRGPRITVSDLASLPDSVERRRWINAMVEAEVARQTYAQDRALAREFALSGLFSDITGSTLEQAIATAMAKIYMGRNWGLNPADSMRYIYFTNGRPNTENEIIAGKLREAGFEMDPEWLEEEIQHKGKPVKRCIGCVLWISKWDKAAQCYKPLLDRQGKPVSVSFTQYDADTAQIWEKGKQIPLSQKWNFQSWGRDMFYWRCVGRVKKYYAPHVLRGVLSRDEATEMPPPTISVEHSPPELLPPDLQSSETPVDDQTEAEAPRGGTRLRDQILAQQENFLKASPQQDPPAETPKKQK
jgi:hypothetical protein